MTVSRTSAALAGSRQSSPWKSSSCPGRATGPWLLLGWLLLLVCPSAAFVGSSQSGPFSSFLSSRRTKTALEAAKYQKVWVAGASRGVGRHIVEHLLAQDANRRVVVLVREAAVADQLRSLDPARVTTHVGDAFEQKTVEDSMDGCDAVISTLGGATGIGETARRIDYIGNNNVIESAGILGITRVVLVTSIGCGSSQAAAPPAVFEVLKDVLAAKERAENVLIKYYTNTCWTIIRPGGLKSEPATGQAILTADPTAIGSIHREDVAHLVVQALEADQRTERLILSAIDPTITSAVHVEGKPIEPFALA